MLKAEDVKWLFIYFEKKLMHEFITGFKQKKLYFVCIVKTRVDKVYCKREERCEIIGDNFIKHKLSL